MATIKVKLRISSGVSESGRIVYQVTHRRDSRRIASGISVNRSRWDSENALVMGGGDADSERINSRIAHDVKMIESIVSRFDTCGEEYSAGDVVKAFPPAGRGSSIWTFMEQEIDLKSRSGKYGTAKTYRTSLSNFSRFAIETGCMGCRLTGVMIEDYQSWMIGRGVGNNTISFYMRTLRAVYMRMVRAGLAENVNPFVNVYTGVAKTRKRAISSADMKRVKSLDLSGDKSLEFVRDMFLLSFYLVGISFVDMAFLKKSDVRSGVISYCRAKTGQRISVGVNGKISGMLKKYASAGESPYLLPIIKDYKGDARKQYLTALRNANKKLKKIGEMAGLHANLTTYTSRHSWASIAKFKNVQLSTISDALGHQSEATTRIYLASLDTSLVDKANDLILRDL